MSSVTRGAINSALAFKGALLVCSGVTLDAVLIDVRPALAPEPKLMLHFFEPTSDRLPLSHLSGVHTLVPGPHRHLPVTRG